MATTDRQGRPWKVYSNGRMLCAESRPYHSAYDAQNNDTDGPCDCVNRTGRTIATFHLPLRTLREDEPPDFNYDREGA